MAQDDEIVLNYDDDDHDAGVENGSGDHGDVNGHGIDGSIAATRHNTKRARPPEDEGEGGADEGEAEKQKKRRKDEWQPQTPQKAPKRKRNKGRGKGKPNDQSSGGLLGAAPSERGRINPVTGLRSAFPGLDDDDDDDDGNGGDGGGGLFYGPATNGIEYLRMVRTEAREVPSLLVAPKEPSLLEEQCAEPAIGYYSDGTYTAAPPLLPTSAATVTATSEAQVANGACASCEEGEVEAEDDNGEHPQSAYRESLLLRFRLLRANLRIPPPAEAIAALDAAHPTSFASKRRTLYARWQYTLRHSDPLPAQVAAMDQQTVLRLIGLLTTTLLKRRRNISPTVARWAWALLGRLEEVGCLANEEVSVVRELGKKAVSLLTENQSGHLPRHQQQRPHPPPPPQQQQQLDDGDDDSSPEAAGEEVDETEEGIGAVLSGLRDGSPREGGTGDVASAVADHEPDLHGKALMENGEEEDGMAIDTSPATQKAKGGLADMAYGFQVAEPVVVEATTGEPIDAMETAKEDALNRLKLPEPTTSAKETSKETQVTGEKEEVYKATAPAAPAAEEVPFPSLVTSAALDMILTIVGEVYGQRDLLEFRESW